MKPVVIAIAGVKNSGALFLIHAYTRKKLSGMPDSFC